jgi:predicted DNA-binding transcriptional regulator YafY
MMFTNEEALGLALGLMAARDLGLSGVAPAIEGALSKLERVMPEALRELIKVLEETVTTAAAWPAARASGEAVVTLATAARDGRRVRMRYRSGLHEQTERQVDTYAMIRRGGYWYVVGYDHLREAMRLFRIDRILEAEPIEATFERPPGFDAPEHVLDALATMPHDHWSVEVVLEATLEEAREQVPTLGVALEETPNEGVILRSSTSDLDWMTSMLAGLRFPFAVRKPPELREALKRQAEKIAVLAEHTQNPSSA